MSYSTFDNVKSMFREFSDGVSTPAVTDAEITEFIDEADTVVNARLKELYTTPITGVESLKIMKMISRNLVADVVDDILNNYKQGDMRPGYKKRAMAVLDQLAPLVDPKTCKRCPPVMFLPDDTYLGANKKGNTLKLAATTGRQYQKGVDSW